MKMPLFVAARSVFVDAGTVSGDHVEPPSDDRCMSHLPRAITKVSNTAMLLTGLPTGPMGSH
jgi:hypothetical protein